MNKKPFLGFCFVSFVFFVEKYDPDLPRSPQKMLIIFFFVIAGTCFSLLAASRHSDGGFETLFGGRSKN